MFLFSKKTIYEGFVGLHFFQGRLIEVLPPGEHGYFRGAHKFVAVDCRPTSEVVGGQEVSTVDSGNLRISLAISHQIEDAALNYRSIQGSEPGFVRRMPPMPGEYREGDRLHNLVQIGIREWVTSRKFKDAFEQRGSMTAEILPSVSAEALKFGVKVLSLDLLDFTASGGLKNAYSDLLKSQIEGEAALARARNESSTMRSLLNTARLVRENPGLLELRVLASGLKPRVTFVMGGEGREAKGVEPEPADS